MIEQKIRRVACLEIIADVLVSQKEKLRSSIPGSADRLGVSRSGK